ncbi:HD domain-containing protein [Rossellomorea vietnamensis]|uniref:HD domain-containing protein n=1 Tax=Rossellomorea vietnamensis TaxID=218284 RepID=A0ACD4C6E1_9BACI|nr:HD domain-containing protein [Rossellomorea vietnamensis]UXH43959.1 HD domain-containing protein [Rossellomorea vietnamensis]
MVLELRNSLIEKAVYLKPRELNVFKSALEFTERAHLGQKRATGEPYVCHPFTVCEILMHYKADSTTLIAALLHDVVEDTDCSLEDIEDQFGPQVALIVDGLTKFEKGSINKELYHALNSEKLLSHAAKDIRVAIVKIADRLHNMRTLGIKKIEKKVPYANETLVFFSPLCERLGLVEFQSELEELAFKYLNPQRYAGVKNLKGNYEKIFSNIFHYCKRHILENNQTPLPVDIKWRSAPIYVSYSKLQEGESLSKLFTIQIITDTPINCYTLLGIIHNSFRPVPNMFRDEISGQRKRFDSHLKTSVMVQDVEVNVEIKTESSLNVSIFHLLNELSVTEIEVLSSDLLRDSIQSVKAVSNDPIEFYELISFELLQNDITIYTPKMDVVSLPNGSTALDFAFFLDPSIATRMYGVKVNGEPKNLYTKLKDMDLVEILMEEHETVEEDWLNHVQTSKAMKEINMKLNNC